MSEGSQQPEIRRHGGSVVFTWPGDPRKVTLSRFHGSSRSIEAEVTLTTVKDGAAYLVTSAKINLQSLPTRKKLAQDFNDRMADPTWLTKVEQICVKGLRTYREGEPIIVLEPSEHTHVPFRLNPLIYENHQTLINAPGGTCKSYTSLYVALVTCHGAQQNGLAAVPCPVLYLDWELDAITTGTRLRALYKGHPELSEYAPYYRRCELPLYDEMDLIGEEVAAKGIKLVIIDSAIMACGDDLSSTQAPVKLQRALRSIGCSSLVLTHCPKNAEENSAYGSVFFRNLCRNQYELRLVEKTRNTALVTLEHTKQNFGPKQDTLGFQFTWDDDGGCRVSSFDPHDHEAAQATLPLAARIRNLLDDGTSRSAVEISEELEEKLATVKAIFSKHNGHKWSSQGSRQHTTWTVLVARNAGYAQNPQGVNGRC
jgi:hypothetical protein